MSDWKPLLWTPEKGLGDQEDAPSLVPWCVSSEITVKYAWPKEEDVSPWPPDPDYEQVWGSGYWDPNLEVSPDHVASFDVSTTALAVATMTVSGPGTWAITAHAHWYTMRRLIGPPPGEWTTVYLNLPYTAEVTVNDDGTWYCEVSDQSVVVSCAVDPHCCPNCGIDAPKGGLPPGARVSIAPSNGDPVILGTGVEDYRPAADLVVPAQTCEPVEWRRGWRSDLAVQQYGSPGLSKGWVHTWDILLQEAESTATWKPLELIYPSGLKALLTPVLDGGGQPTGAFTGPAGADYYTTGVASATPGRWQSVTLTFSDQTTWVFTYQSDDDIYQIVHRGNRMGNGVDFAWDTARRLTTVTETATSEVLLTFNYDTNGRLTSAVDAYGRKVAYTWTTLTGTGFSGDQVGLTQVSQVVASGQTTAAARWTYGWQEESALAGAGTVDDLDPTILLLRTISVPNSTGDGVNTARLDYYETVYRVARRVDGNGVRTDYSYGDQQAMITVIAPDLTLVNQRTVTYNAYGQTTGGSAAGTPTIAYGDSRFPGKPTSVSYPDGRSESMTYDSHGNLATQTDARGTLLTNTWDYTSFALGRLTQVTRTPSGGTARTIAAYTYYEPSGLVHTATTLEPGTTDGSTVTSTYTYDALGNVLTVTTPGNNAATTLTTTYEYETDGTYTTTTKLGQPIKVSCPGTCARHYRYDARGNRTLYTDALGNTWETAFNLVDQPTVSYEPATGQQGSGRAQRQMTYAWTGGPQVELNVLDEAGNVVQTINTTYGGEGEVLAVTGGTEPVSYTYDPLYRTVALADGNGNVTRYAYNADGRLALTRYPGATADTGADTLRQTSYDLAGRLLQRIDGNGLTCDFAYNEAGGALTNVSYPTQSSYNVSYTHDTLGRVTSMTDAQGTISTTYDDLGNPLTVTTAYTGLDPQTVTYTYYPNGQRASMNTPGGLFEYEYSVNGQMTSLDGPAGTTGWTWLDNQQLGAMTLANGAYTEYTYLPNGRLSTLTNKDDQGAVLSRYLDMQYRGTGDLAHVESDVPGHSDHTGTTDFTYDLRRQLVREVSTRHLPGESTGYDRAYGYDNAGNPTSWRGATRTFNSDNQETTGGNWTYDGNGNPTSHGGVTCTYDVGNHLTGFGSEFTAGYRGDGLRAWQESGTTRKYYVYDGWRPVCELDDAGTVLRSWTFGANGLVAYGQALDLYDWQGNAVNAWTESGTPVTGVVMDAWGQADGAYKFQHGYLSSGEELILCTFRHLDPSRGRWVTRDPIGYEGGIGLYGYVAGNPVSQSDSLGLMAGIDDAIVIGGAWLFIDMLAGALDAVLVWVAGHWVWVAGAGAVGGCVCMSQHGRGNKRLTKYRNLTDQEVLERLAEAERTGDTREAADLKTEAKGRGLRRCRESHDRR